MKKLILAFLALSVMIAANAGTANSNLNLTGSVSSSCTQSLSASNLTWTFIPNQTPTQGHTTLTIGCTYGTVISSFTAASANGWQFKGTSSNFSIPYTVTTGGYGVNFYIPWNGSVGSTTPVEELSQGPLTMGKAGTANGGTNGSNSIPVEIYVNPDTIANNAPVDSYTDTIVLTSSF